MIVNKILNLMRSDSEVFAYTDDELVYFLYITKVGMFYLDKFSFEEFLEKIRYRYPVKIKVNPIEFKPISLYTL